MKDGLRFVDSTCTSWSRPTSSSGTSIRSSALACAGPSAPTAGPGAAPPPNDHRRAGPAPGDADMPAAPAKRARAGATQSTQPLSGSRLADTGRWTRDQRNYDAEAR